MTGLAARAGRRPRSPGEAFLPLRSTERARHPAGAVEDNPSLQAIWEVVCAIPRGRVSTYGAVAAAAGLPGRARLTGYALRMAPRRLNLPWHRVVGAGGRIVFGRTSPQYREQAAKLRAEGVGLTDGRVPHAAIADLDEKG